MIEPRIRGGIESDTHFLYTDSRGREWSVVDFEKFMTDVPGYSSREFGYRWEGMFFGEGVPDNQFRGETAEEVIEQIEEQLKSTRTN